MAARAAGELPTGRAWRYEPKFDGFRAAVLWRRDGVVRLQSRQLRSLTEAFPENEPVQDAAAGRGARALPAGCRGR
jgi:ATP-dependent DNA ligase